MFFHAVLHIGGIVQRGDVEVGQPLEAAGFGFGESFARQSTAVQGGHGAEDVLLHEVPAIAAVFLDLGVRAWGIVEDLGNGAHQQARLGGVATDRDAMFTHGKFTEGFQTLGGGRDHRIPVINLDDQTWSGCGGGKGHEDPAIARVDESECLRCRCVWDWQVENLGNQVVQRLDGAAVDVGDFDDADGIGAIENHLACSAVTQDGCQRIIAAGEPGEFDENLPVLEWDSLPRNAIPADGDETFVGFLLLWQGSEELENQLRVGPGDSVEQGLEGNQSGAGDDGHLRGGAFARPFADGLEFEIGKMDFAGQLVRKHGQTVFLVAGRE